MNHALSRVAPLGLGIVLLTCTFFSVCSSTWADEPYRDRAYYEAKYEPLAEIIHGAGQTYSQEPQNSAFDNYSTMMASQGTKPLVFMGYMSAGTGQSFYTNLKNRLDAYEAAGQYTIPQFGYYLPSGSTAITETQLANLSNGLKSLGRPVYLRIGYEMNGTWYDPMYEPATYISNFRSVVTRLRADDVPFASLWNMYPGYDSGGGSGGYYGTWSYMSQFYPGDEYVDWFSMDLFSTTDITNPHTADFIAQADGHGKPIMIGEATPRYVGADDAADWDAWFSQFFSLIQDNPGIKGHTYIDWDWSGTRWPTWGDALLESGDSTVRAKYLTELANGIYYHSGDDMPYFVPEPASIVLLGAGGLALLRRHRRRV